MNRTTVAGSLARCLTTIAAAAAAPPPTADAENGDTHVVAEGIERTPDCNDAAVADGVTHDLAVYGFDQTVFYHNGAPLVGDRGRELGMTNRLQQVPG